MRFVVSEVSTKKAVVASDLTPCILVEFHRRFRGFLAFITGEEQASSYSDC
jgi:hypothetical protein